MNDQHTTAAPSVVFLKFPNGVCWLRGVNGNISGVVTCSGFENAGSLEDRIDLISECATGTTSGLIDFSYQHFGSDFVSFNGYINEDLFIVGTDVKEDDSSEQDDGREVLEVIAGDALIHQLVKQYQIDHGEAQHAVESMDINYGRECVLNIAGTDRAIHSPVYPSDCDYIRVVIGGTLEIAYWNSSEWKESPAEVMGAIIGAANGRP